MEEKLDNNISLFIPVYNIESSFESSLKEFYTALSQLNCNFEIIVVDDHSKAGPSRFEGLIDGIKKSPGREIRYLYYQAGPSRRENLARSFYLARNEIFGFIDADLAYDIPFLLKAVRLLEESSADIVIGSRYALGAKIKRRLIRGVISFFYNLVMKWVFNSRIRDHQCGLKFFRKTTAMPIIDRMGYDDKFARGWFWDAEFLIRAQRAHLKIIEMPVEWRETDSSTFSVTRELRMLSSIAALKKELG